MFHCLNAKRMLVIRQHAIIYNFQSYFICTFFAPRCRFQLFFAYDTLRIPTKEEKFVSLQYHVIIHQMKTESSLCKLITRIKKSQVGIN